MKNSSKKMLALLLALVMAFAVFAAGCAPASETPATTSPTSGTANTPAGDTNTPVSQTPATGDSAQPGLDTAYNFGVNVWGAGVPILDAFGDNAQYTAEVMGCTYIRASDDFTADKELTNVQNFLAAGVDGILLQAAAVATMPQMAALCMEAETPFVLFTFIGDDKDHPELEQNNPYYVGAIDSDMVTDGYLMAQAALRDGCRTAVLIGGNIGDNNMDQRAAGFTQGFEEGGGTVLLDQRCTDASECAQKAEDMLSANMDVDCVYAMVGDYIPGSLSAIDKLGLQDSVKVYMSCVDPTSAEYIKEGRIVEGNDGIVVASYIAPTLMINYLDGHKILTPEGTAPRFRTVPFSVNQDNVDSYISVFCDPNKHPFTEDMIKSLCFRNNPEVDYQTYVDFIEALDLNAFLHAHGMPEV